MFLAEIHALFSVPLFICHTRLVHTFVRCILILPSVLCSSQWRIQASSLHGMPKISPLEKKITVTVQHQNMAILSCTVKNNLGSSILSRILINSVRKSFKFLCFISTASSYNAIEFWREMSLNIPPFLLNKLRYRG